MLIYKDRMQLAYPLLATSIINALVTNSVKLNYFTFASIKLYFLKQANDTNKTTL